MIKTTNKFMGNRAEVKAISFYYLFCLSPNKIETSLPISLLVSCMVFLDWTLSRVFGRLNNYSMMVKCHTRFGWRKGSLIIKTPFVVNIRIFLVGNQSISQTTSSGSVLARNMGLVFKAGVKFTGTGFIVSM